MLCVRAAVHRASPGPTRTIVKNVPPPRDCGAARAVLGDVLSRCSTPPTTQLLPHQTAHQKMERLAQCGKEGRRLEKSEVDSVLASGKVRMFDTKAKAKARGRKAPLPPPHPLNPTLPTPQSRPSSLATACARTRTWPGGPCSRRTWPLSTSMSTWARTSRTGTRPRFLRTERSRRCTTRYMSGVCVLVCVSLSLFCLPCVPMTTIFSASVWVHCPALLPYDPAPWLYLCPSVHESHVTWYSGRRSAKSIRRSCVAGWRCRALFSLHYPISACPWVFGFCMGT